MSVAMNEAQVLKEHEDLIRVCFLKLRYNENKHLKEDLFQEGRLALLLAARSWDEQKGSFRMFAWFCVRNAMVDFLRGQKGEGSTTVGASQLIQVQTSALNPEEAYSRAEISDLIRRSIKELSTREQTILGLRLDEELTLTETSKRVAVSQSRVQQIEQQAISQLANRVVA